MRLLTSFAPLFAPRFRVRGTKTLCRMSTQAAAKSEERFDLLNEDGSLKGVSKARSLVHRDGDLHRAVHIWVLARGNPPKLLLQKRSEEKDTFPGRWDVSVGGHITAGDEVVSSAERELEEELGLTLDNGAGLDKIFEVRSYNTGSTVKSGSFIDNELQDIFVYKREKAVSLDELKLQEEEVTDARWWDWPEFRDAQRNSDERFVPRPSKYIDLLEQYIAAWYPQGN